MLHTDRKYAHCSLGQTSCLIEDHIAISLSKQGAYSGCSMKKGRVIKKERPPPSNSEELV